MTDNFASAAVPALCVVALVGILMAGSLARRHGTVFNVPTGLILMYVLVMPISGIVHILQIPGGTRGFFDILSHGHRNIDTDLTVSVLISAAGLVALWVGMMVVNPAPSRTLAKLQNFARSTRIWLISGVLLLPITVIALGQVQALRSLVDQTRVWGFDGGNARLVFLASWLPWAITFIALALSRFAKFPLVHLILGGVAAYSIYLATDWSGGRSQILLFAFPLAIWMAPKLGRWRAAALIAVGASVVWVIVQGTLARTATFAVQEVNVAGIIDWEWGRFSMSTFAVGYVDRNGLLLGETYLSSLAQIPVSVLNILGAEITLPLRSISQVTAQDLLGSSSLNYTVPGAVAEAYMNFGAAGTFLLLFTIGVAATWLDRLARRTASASVRLFALYLIALLLFRSLVAESVSLFTFVAFTGLPLVIVAIIDLRRSRRAKDTPAVNHQEPRRLGLRVG